MIATATRELTEAEKDLYWRKDFDHSEQKAYIQQCLAEKGDDWVMAAMIDGSIGYHSVKHCEILISRFRAGEETDWCERCDACFKCDLIRMMFCDCIGFARQEAQGFDSVAKNIAFVKATRNLSDEHQTMLTLAYPTMGI